MKKEEIKLKLSSLLFSFYNSKKKVFFYQILLSINDKTTANRVSDEYCHALSSTKIWTSQKIVLFR